MWLKHETAVQRILPRKTQSPAQNPIGFTRLVLAGYLLFSKVNLFIEMPGVVGTGKKRGRPSKSSQIQLAEGVAPDAALPVPALHFHDPSQQFTREDLIAGLQGKQFHRVAFMVGAGISVAAGIPDFRSPKSGLYAQVKEMGLPCPEDIFSLEYLQYDPQPFFTLAKCLFHETQPVGAHRFMKACALHKALHMVYTQNIDGLELTAGIPMSKVLQAHGHMRSAHCIACKAAFPIEEFIPYTQRDEVMRCPCNGIVKPDIIFFGEKVPKCFETMLAKIRDADLLIVMGTSLQVKPFSELLKHIPSTVPMVMINRDLPKAMCSHEKALFLQGDIEEVVSSLAEDIGWDISINQGNTNKPIKVKEVEPLEEVCTHSYSTRKRKVQVFA